VGWEGAGPQAVLDDVDVLHDRRPWWSISVSNRAVVPSATRMATPGSPMPQ